MTPSPLTPFFVLGHPRSGTTALARLLDLCDKAACLHYEGNLIYRLHRILARYRVLEEPHIDLITDVAVTARHNLIDKPCRFGVRKPVFGETAIVSLIEGFSEDLKKIQDTRVLFHRTAERFFRLFPREETCRAVGDKVPTYIGIPQALQAAVPGGKLLYIKRDPRASVHSVLCFAKERLHLFAAPDALAMGIAWVLNHCNMEKLKHLIEADRLLVLQQETLMSKPCSTVGRAADFLGFSVDDAIKPHIDAVSRRGAIKDWRGEMALEDIDAVESVLCEAGLRRELSGSLHGPHHNGWSDKVAALMPLIDCRVEAVIGVIRTAKAYFKGRRASETLGHALVQFADWAHLKADDVRAGMLFAEALRLLPEDPVLQYKYGEFCFDTKRLECAKCLFQSAANACPATDYYRFLKAKILYRLGRIDRLCGKSSSAEDFFKNSLDVFKDFALPKAFLKAMVVP